LIRSSLSVIEPPGPTVASALLITALMAGSSPGGTWIGRSSKTEMCLAQAEIQQAGSVAGVALPLVSHPQVPNVSEGGQLLVAFRHRQDAAVYRTQARPIEIPKGSLKFH
jgi:hypothetical protein